jgi:hypothetical protein
MGVSPFLQEGDWMAEAGGFPRGPGNSHSPLRGPDLQARYFTMAVPKFGLSGFTSRRRFG